jgi:hypothetical protein
LPIGERSALAAALKNSKLPIEDIEAPGRLFWRFETVHNVSVGFLATDLPESIARSRLFRLLSFYFVSWSACL